MTNVRSILAVAAVLAGMALPPTARAQDSTRVPSQTLLRRLAEAVDGNRGRGAIFIVASYDSLNRVDGVFRDRERAAARARALGRSYDVFGPFRSDLPEPCSHDPDDPDPCVRPCVHDALTSLRAPRASMCPPSPVAIRTGQIDSLFLTFRLKDGRIQRVVLPPTADAIFLTFPALDKFAFPYYSRIIGLDSAAAMRSAFARLYRPQ
jgi:hypothetical protein